MPFSTAVGWLGIAIVFHSFKTLEKKDLGVCHQKEVVSVRGGTNAYHDLNIAQHTWSITWFLFSMYSG